MAKLTIRDDQGEREFRLTGDPVTIGRADSNTVVISDPKSSKEHCRFEFDGSRWKVTDLESKNGTRVNADYKNHATLRHGDTVRIGKTEILLELASHEQLDAPATTGGATRSARSGGTAAAPAERTAGGAPRTRAGREQDEYEDEPRAPRRARGSDGDVLLKLGLIVVGVLGVLIILNNVAKGLLSPNEHAPYMEHAKKLRSQGNYAEAAEYLWAHLDESKSGHEVAMELAEDIERKVPANKSHVDTYTSARLEYVLGRNIRAYHAGSDTATADIILKQVERMRREFSATDSGKRAAKQYSVWFSGLVPERGSNEGVSDAVQEAWETAVAQSKDFERSKMFREAGEVVRRFLVQHEAVLSAEKAEYYRSQESAELHRLKLAASSAYTAKRQSARKLIRNKRYDEATKIYQKVIETFGLDEFIRKARSEIEAIALMKAQGG
ncbi:MAG: FHA domain-containing protein [Planctomycetota bacterium]